MTTSSILRHILLVEDNPADVELTREAFSRCATPIMLHAVRNGDAALGFLRRQEEYAACPAPSLVLLDLNLPGTSGAELLQELKNSEALRQVPVIVLSTTSSPLHIREVYERQANCYVVKPVDFGQFVRVVRSIETLWLAEGTQRLTSDASSAMNHAARWQTPRQVLSVLCRGADSDEACTARAHATSEALQS